MRSVEQRLNSECGARSAEGRTNAERSELGARNQSERGDRSSERGTTEERTFPRRDAEDAKKSNNREKENTEKRFLATLACLSERQRAGVMKALISRKEREVRQESKSLCFCSAAARLLRFALDVDEAVFANLGVLKRA